MFSVNSFAQTSNNDDIEKLARQMANPLSSITNIPLQNNFDFKVGPYSGFRYNLNVQPIFSFRLTENWNVMSRSIVSFISQNNVIAENSSQTGIGDILQSFFLTPGKVKSKFIWGAGPVISIPTATNDVFRSNKWSIGPTILLVRKDKHFTVGALMNSLWSFAGSGTNDVSTTFIQPFISYTAKRGRSYSMGSENTQDWNNDIFGGDITIILAQILKIKKQIIQFGIGPKFYYGNNPYNPKWGIRFNIALIYPKNRKTK